MRLKSVVSSRINRSLASSLLLWALTTGASCKPASTPPPQSADDALVDGAPRRAKPAASSSVKAAEALLNKGDAQGAREKFEAALAENPGDARALLGLGLAHEALGDQKAAEKAYRSAIQADDSLAEAHNNLGLVLRDQDKLSDAIAAFEAALTRDPNLASAAANLALAYEDAGQPEQAQAAYQRAVALTPKDAMLQANYGLFLLNQGNASAAVDALRNGLKVAAGDRAALLALGNGLRRAEKPDEAVRALRGAIEADDGKPTAALLSELALAQNAADDAAGAKASLEQALKLDPNYVTAHYLLGSVLAGQGDYQAASEHYQRCITLAPRSDLAARAKQKLELIKQAKKQK